MGMVVRSNIMAANANRQLGMNNSAVGKNLEKLSSGFKINRAGDDASGLAISEKMKAQIKGLETASANSQDGISLVQTAEGALTEVHDMLNRMTELATKSANGTIKDEVDRDALQSEMDALATEVDRIAQSTNFNGIKLLDGSLSSATTGGTPDVTLTQPTSKGITETTTGAVNATAVYTFNLAGMAAKGAGDIEFEFGAKKYTVTVADGDDDTAIATKLRTAMNADKITAAGTGDFTAAGNGTAITLTAANDSQVPNGTIPTGFTVAAKAPAATAKKYASEITGDDGTNALAANDTVVIGGKTYTLTANNSTGDNIGIDVSATFADQMKAIVDKYNAEAGEDFTATYEKGKLILASKDGTDKAAPTVTITDNAGALSAGTPAPAGGSLDLQIGDSSDAFNRLSVSINKTDMATLFAGADAAGNKAVTKTLPDGTISLDINKQANARTNMEFIKTAINIVSTTRAELGATQNRLEHTINNLDVASENMNAANSRIRDTDMAKQMMDYTKMNVLTQAAQAMLAQANQQPQGVLQLLQ